MRIGRIRIAVVLLALAFAAYALGVANLSLRIGRTEINVYLSAALALAAVVVLWRGGLRPRGRRPG